MDEKTRTSIEKLIKQLNQIVTENEKNINNVVVVSSIRGYIKNINLNLNCNCKDVEVKVRASIVTLIAYLENNKKVYDFSNIVELLEKEYKRSLKSA